MRPLFITGIGTGIGKTVVSAIITTALGGDYWKPVQAGINGITDSEWVRSMIRGKSKVHPELYKLKMSASPHISSREEGLEIVVEHICRNLPMVDRNLIIEGAGGILVPLNSKEFVIDLIHALDARVILVSRNYLGSINHSLMTSRICKEEGLDVAGWIFNDQYMDYEMEIVEWTGLRKLASIPRCNNIQRDFIDVQANVLKDQLASYLC